MHNNEDTFYPLLKKNSPAAFVKRDNIFHSAIEKGNIRFREKRNRITTDTDRVPVRNFIIPFVGFDHGHRQKSGFRVTFRR